MKVSICKPYELGFDELHLWRKLQKDDPRLASPFLAPEFAVAFANHFDSARVAVLEDETGIVGFFPHEKRLFQVGKTLAYNLSDTQALICSQEYSFDPLELLKACGLAVLEFDHIAGYQSSLFSLAGPTELLPTPVVDLAANFEEWLKDKRQTSSHIRQALRQQRKLDREVGLCNFVFDSLAPADLTQLMSWKSAQYIRTGRKDRFADHRFCGFVEELFATRTDDFQVRLTRLEAGERVAALCLSLWAPDRLAYWFPTYDTGLASYSPGTICLLHLIETAGKDGLVRLDLGKGSEEYKQWFKNFDDQVAEGWIQRQSPAALCRRLQQSPKRALLKVVLGTPRLRTAARSALNGLGRIRQAAANAKSSERSRRKGP